MEINGNVKLFRHLVDAPETLVVVEDAVGHPMDHRALHAELLYAALEFACCGIRQRRWQAGETGEAGWVARASLGKAVIDAACEIDGDLGPKFLAGRRAMRENLHINARRIHFGKADFADIIEPPEQVFAAQAFGASQFGCKLAVPVMLFDGDDWNVLEHVCVSPTARAVALGRLIGGLRRGEKRGAPTLSLWERVFCEPSRPCPTRWLPAGWERGRWG